MQKLIIFLPNNMHPDWILLDENAYILPHADIEIAELAEDKQIIVLVPAEDVLITFAKLPKMNRAKLADVLPFALEEQVIGDVETLHFVPARTINDDNVPVAVVAKEKMKFWMQQLEIMNVQPDIIMPFFFSLPCEENTWTIVMHDMAMMRMNNYHGFSCDKHNLQELLDIALNSSENKPAQIHIYNYTNNSCQLNLSIPVKEEMRDTKQYEADLALNVLNQDFINLLHGEFRSRKVRFPEMRKLWKINILLASIAIFSLLLYPVVSFVILNKRTNEINSQIAVIYKRHFPQSVDVVAPKLRIQQKLQEVTKGTSGNKFAVLMAYIGEGMKTANGIHLKRLNYQQQKIVLELTANSSGSFSRFTGFLSQAGLKVKQDSATLDDNEVNATITVE